MADSEQAGIDGVMEGASLLLTGARWLVYISAALYFFGDAGKRDATHSIAISLAVVGSCLEAILGRLRAIAHDARRQREALDAIAGRQQQARAVNR